jgi:hypothetical protein
MKVSSTINTICILLSLIAIVGKALHLPLMAVLLIISLSMSSVIFFLQTFLSTFYFKEDPRIMLISIVSCAGLSMAAIGILFRFMFWPGWMGMLVVGLSLLAICLIGMLASQSQVRGMEADKRKMFTWAIALPSILFAVLGILGCTLPEDVFWNIFSSQSA